jgi:hypothetical protein
VSKRAHRCCSKAAGMEVGARLTFSLVRQMLRGFQARNTQSSSQVMNVRSTSGATAAPLLPLLPVCYTPAPGPRSIRPNQGESSWIKLDQAQFFFRSPSPPISPLTSHLSPLTSHLSPLTPHSSLLTPHSSLLTPQKWSPPGPGGPLILLRPDHSSARHTRYPTPPAAAATSAPLPPLSTMSQALRTP